MAEFNVQQQKVINHYREMYNIASIISDDVVVGIIKLDIIQSGKVYAGFESLVQGVSKSSQNNRNTGVFGFGFNNDENIELVLSNNTSQYLTLLPTQKESQALGFMKKILQESKNTIAEREKEAGMVSAFTNFFRTIVLSEYSKRNVNKEVEKFEKQLKEIEKAARGEKVYRDFLGNVSTITFKDEFKKYRSVEFNADKITATIEKTAEIANIRTCYQSVQAVKELLGYSSTGIYNITHPQEATNAILQAFEVLGVTKGEDKANLLKQIFEQYKDHPVMKEYNCKGLTFDKNQNGEYCIYRWLDYEGNSTEAPMEVIRLIVGELVNRLDKTLATGLNIEFDENTTPDELSKLCNESISKHEEEYQKMFAESFGGKNVKELSDEYVLKQQQDVATVEMVGNMVGMALMLLPGGVTATSGWLLKTGKFAQTAQKMAKVGSTLTKVQKIASPLVMGNMILSPTQLIEQGFSENGFSDEELDEWKNRVVQNSVYMVAGMGASKIAQNGAAMYKTKALVNSLKSAGKSTDEIMAMIKANPVKFPNEIVKGFNKIDNIAKALQVTSEVALDLGSTIALNKVMNNGDLLPMDVVNSIAFALMGGVVQKDIARLNGNVDKIDFILKEFKEFGVTETDAKNILQAMDDISLGKVQAENIKPLENHHDSQMLDEVVVTDSKGNTTKLTLSDRLATASSREDFVAIRDEIKAMPAGAEKTALQEEYLRKYNEFSRKYNEKFDIRMQCSQNFEETPEAYQSVIERNKKILQDVYDLYNNGDLTKLEAAGIIFGIMNDGYDLSNGESPNVSTVRKDLNVDEELKYYAEYIEYLNEIKINEELDLDMLISQYSHEMHHFFQAKEVNKTVSLQEKHKTEAYENTVQDMRDKKIRFNSRAEFDEFVARRAEEYEELFNQTNWNDILNNGKYAQNVPNSSEYTRGVNLYKNSFNDDYYGNVCETEAYTIGTATYIELQKSVHNSISQVEYNILNDINIVLHENYNELPPQYKRLTQIINLYPKDFVDDVKYIIREINEPEVSKILEYLLQIHGI